MTHLEYRIRLVLEQRDTNKNGVWGEAGVSQTNEKFLRIHSSEPEKAFHALNDELVECGPRLAGRT